MVHRIPGGGNDNTLDVAADGGDPGVPSSTPAAAVAWVELIDAASGLGRIMLLRHQGGRDSDDAAAIGLANDNPIWVGEEDGDGFGGVIGRDPAVADLHTGDVLISWIGAGNIVHAKLYPPDGAVAPADADNDVATAEHAAVNAALANLGEVAEVPGTARRLQVAELGPGNFAVMWIALSANGHELRGSIFSRPSDTPAGDVLPDGWTQVPVTPVALPAGFTGQFSLMETGEANPDLALSYTAQNGTQGIDLFAVRVDGLTGREPGQHGDALLVETTTQSAQSGGAAGMVGDRFIMASLDAHAGGDGKSGADHAAGIGTVLTPVGWGETPDMAANGFKIAGDANDTEAQFAPIVKATDEAFIAAWEVPGATAGAVGIRMSMYDPLGRPTLVGGGPGTVIDVTDNAEAGVAPAIAGIGAGAVAAYVAADTGALAVQVFDRDGQPIGPTLDVDLPGTGAISEIAVASQAVAGAAIEDQFAVIAVQNNGDADPSYGNIVLQRYGVTVDADDVPQTPVALGRDGAVDGNDAAAVLQVDTGTPDAPHLENVVGRAPQAVDLHDGQLALVWVEPDGAGRETIRGEVIEPREGSQILRIDLTDMLESAGGVVQGTEPILASAGEGGILVSWLQADPAGGFVLMAAVYEAVGDSAWAVPELPVALQHFAEEPMEFDLSVVGDTDISLIVTWREDGSGTGSSDIHGQRFDIAGHAVGAEFDVTANRPVDPDSQSASDVSAAAGMPDGRFVVIYTEADSHGDVDVEARLFDTRSAEPPSIASDAGTILDGTDGYDTSMFAGLSGEYVITQDANGAFAAAPDTHPSTGSPAAEVTVVEDATDGVLIDVLGNDTGAGLRVTQVNGADIAIGVPLAVDNGFVQLRDDGQLLFTADAGFSGTAAFAYTVADGTDQLAAATVTVHVTPPNDAPIGIDLSNLSVAENALGAVIGAVSVLDPDLGDTHEVTVSDDKFEVVDGNLKLKADQSLDFDTSPSINLSLTATDAGGLATTQTFTINVLDLSETPISISLDAAAVEENSESGAQAIANLATGDADANDPLAFDGGAGNDTFMFQPGFGNDTASPSGDSANDQDAVDLSQSGYATFTALLAAGALSQVGADVVITLNPLDTASPDKITLKGVSLSTLDVTDFKFG